MSADFHLQARLSTLYGMRQSRFSFASFKGEDFLGWQREFRTEVRRCLAIPEPSAEPVYSVRLSIREYATYREEKYTLYRGELPIPMYILTPNVPPPYRAVLAFHGHDAGAVQAILGHEPDEMRSAHTRDTDGNYAQALAEAGYLVCAIEQQGMGERITDQLNNGRSCRHLAFEYLMQGRTLLGERCLDGMAALTYLQSRSDITVIGCTGHSGGGTTALWLSALDERVQVAVISCYLCSFRQSILGMTHCECNYVPRILELGEMGDIATLIAPRPVCFIAGDNDPIFPITGAYEQYETVLRAYESQSAPCTLAVHSRGHAYDFLTAQSFFEQML